MSNCFHFEAPSTRDSRIDVSFAETRQLPHNDMERVYEDLVEFASSRYDRAGRAANGGEEEPRDSD
ncbi:MAG TPA: hypothetical protein VHW45_20185 [Candidatus Sulfotelmatobacter sp.]|jgi:hypothetical protein|nr:hypothetical protein [Candidatus Sulfotelmatobacter sp.]